MFYRRLADFVVVLHCLVALFFLGGGFFSWVHPGLAVIHIPLAIWVSAAFLMGWTCPLTPLENRLRKLAGSRGYEGSFVDHYLGRFVLEPTGGPVPTAIGRRNERILGAVFCILTILPHGVNLGHYHDAIWLPQPKPPRISSSVSSAPMGADLSGPSAWRRRRCWPVAPRGLSRPT